MAAELIAGGLPFSANERSDVGLSDRRLRQAVMAGTLRQPLRGVYVDAAVSDTPQLRAAALAHVLPPGAAVARRTAAWLYGVDARDPGAQLLPPPLECVVPVGVEPVSRPGVASYQAPLTPDDVAVVGSVPVTVPVRTTLDILRLERPHIALGAADAMARLGLVDAEEILGAAHWWRGFRGVAQARYLASLIEPSTESHGESWLRLRIVDAGFPKPQVQIEVTTSTGVIVYRLDLGWREYQAAVEYDGEAHHSSLDAIRRDERRRNDLSERFGWRVLVANKGDVLGHSMALEKAIGDLLGREPSISRRRW